MLASRAKRRGAVGVLDALLLGCAFLAPVMLALTLLRRPDEDTLPEEFARRDLLAAAVLFVVLTVVISGTRIRPLRLRVALLLVAIASVGAVSAQYRGLIPGTRSYEVSRRHVAHRLLGAPFHVVERPNTRISSPDPRPPAAA